MTLRFQAKSGFAAVSLLMMIGSIGLVFILDPTHSASAADPAVEQLSREVQNLGWIIFGACSENKDWDLVVCRPDGSQMRNLTHTPNYNEVIPQFSHDGKKILYRRLRRELKIDNNNFGTQGELVLANCDGSEPQVLGKEGEYAWACWNPDNRQIACLTLKGILILDVESKQVVRQMERRGFFQQLGWSPDGKWFSGVANNFGTAWTIARMDVASGVSNAVSRVDCCTPDWFPDSQNLIFSSRPPGQKENNGYGWTQLWRADGEGKERRLVYGEDGRHVYGGCVSPNGKYVLFTGNVNEDGDPGNQGAPMGLMRLADAPIIGGESRELRKLHPQAKNGPVLVLPTGWEPSWTFNETGIAVSDSVTQGNVLDSTAVLAQELHSKGWIAFSAETDAGDWDLFLMRPDGSDKQNLTNTKEFTEGGVRFSPDGNKMFYYRMPKNTPLDNNTYGTFTLILANADGSDAQVFGDTFPWAAWGPHSDQIACLDKKGIQIVDIASKRILRTVPRHGFVQQLGWSADEKWFCGTANGLGQFWTIGRINAQTGAVNPVSETDRYNCTPDWFADAQYIIYSRGIIPQQPGWAELWMADGDGKNRRLLFAESNRHLYGGALSPDDQYVLFTRSETDLGEVKNTRTRLAILRFADTPMWKGDQAAYQKQYPQAKSGPVLDLGWGWEPAWTFADFTTKK